MIRSRASKGRDPYTRLRFRIIDTFYTLDNGHRLSEKNLLVFR
jgi:hypothetical protein